MPFYYLFGRVLLIFPSYCNYFVSIIVVLIINHIIGSFIFKGIIVSIVLFNYFEIISKIVWPRFGQPMVFHKLLMTETIPTHYYIYIHSDPPAQDETRMKPE